MALDGPLGTDRDDDPLNPSSGSSATVACAGKPLRDFWILEILSRASVFPASRTVSLDLSARAPR